MEHSPDTKTAVIDRHAARVLLIDRLGRVLLLQCKEPGADHAFWITPGGGLQSDETHEQAALRELYEETGLNHTPLGPCIWTRTHTFAWLGKIYRQHERFYLVQIESHNVTPACLTEEESGSLIDHRWWSADEIIQAKHELFAPSGLGKLLSQIDQSLFAQSDKQIVPIDVGS